MPEYGLRARLLAGTILVAASAVAATAWLSVQRATTSIAEQENAVRQAYPLVYEAVIDYAATHTTWSTVGPVLAGVAQETGVRVVVTPVGGRPIESSPASSADPHGAEPSVAIDPLTVDNALAATRFPDGIDPKVTSPFLLTTQEHADLEVLVEKAAACLRANGLDAGIAEVASGRPYLRVPRARAPAPCRVVLAQGGGYVGFEDSPSITPTATEQAALTQLAVSMKGCVKGGAVELSLTGTGEVANVGSPVDDSQDRACLLNARRLQLRPYVAPAAFMEAMPLGQAGGQVTVGLSAADTWRIAGVATVVAVLAVGVAMLLANRVIRPVRALTEATRRMRAGDGTARAATSVVAVSAVTGTAVYLLRFHPSAAPAAKPAPPQTTTIERTDLAISVTLQGTLGYGTTTPFTGRKSGTVTGLPAVGAVVGQGQTLYSVDAQPVVVFLGATPLYRAINSQATPGPDIAEVNANLRALGYGIAPSGDAYTPGTESALKKWQQSKGLAANGSLAIGDLAVLPAPVRVASLDAQLGAAATADLLGLSSTTKHVTASVDPRQIDTSVLTRGLKVSLSLPDGKQTTGTISTLSSPGAAAQSGSPASGGNAGAGGPSMTVDVADQSALSGMDSGSVGVAVTTGSAKDVLAVPVETLVAVQGGGYAVQVVTGTGETSTLVGVQTGLFANGLVQISGQGITEGLKVVTVS
jgi:hypothetical protein